MRGFKEEAWVFLLRDRFQKRLFPIFVWNEPDIAKALHGEAADGDGGCHRGRARNHFNRTPRFHYMRYKLPAWIIYPWRSRIRHIGNSLPRLNPLDNFLKNRIRRVLMHSEKRLLDFIVLHKLPRHPRILTRDHARFFQNSKRPKRDIFEVSDRGCNDREDTRHRARAYRFSSLNAMLYRFLRSFGTMEASFCMFFSRFPRSLLFGALLGSLALTGFGCKKIESYRPNTTSARPNGQVLLPTISVETKPEQPSAPKEKKPERRPAPEIIRLRESMASLQKSRSFRAKLTIGGPNGIKGDIAYSQTNGLYGKLALANGMTSEMSIFKDRVAVRNGTSTWGEVTGTPEADSITALFQSITNRGGQQPLYPSDNSRYGSAKEDTVRGCMMHSVSQFMGNLGGYQPLQICIKAGLPIYFSIPSEDGVIEIEYRDIDQPVDVFFPIP